MRQLLGIALVLSCGCDRLLGLTPVTATDADTTPCVYSADPADEDCDGVANAADPCPADGGPTDNVDDDGDGVGNACDPAPTAETIRLFDGFSDNRNGWNAASGSWKPDGGAFVNTGDGVLKLTLPAPVTSPMVEVVIDDIATTGDAVVGAYGANSFNSYTLTCEVAITATGETVVFTDSYSTTHASAPLSGTGRLRIQAGLFGDSHFHCRARHGDDVDVDLAGTFSVTGPMMTDMGLQATGATARFDSLTLVGAP